MLEVSLEKQLRCLGIFDFRGHQSFASEPRLLNNRGWTSKS